MSEVQLRPATGLAGLLGALQPRVEASLPPPDLDAIRTEGHAAGFAQGVAEATTRERAALAPLQAQLATAAAALAAAAVIDAERLRPLVADVVRQLAQAVLMAELQHDPALLMALVDAALAALVPGQPAVLTAHPETLAAIAPHLLVAAGATGLTTAADAAFAADRITVSGHDFIIDTSLAARLADILGERG